MKFLRNGEALHHREVHVSEGWTANGVAALIAKLSGLPLGIEPLERSGTNPMTDRVRAVVGVAREVRAAGEKAGNRRRGCLERNIRTVIHGERCGGVGAGDSVELPTVKQHLPK